MDWVVAVLILQVLSTTALGLMLHGMWKETTRGLGRLEALQGEIRHLERYIDGKVDLLLNQRRETEPVKVDLREVASDVVREIERARQAREEIVASASPASLAGTPLPQAPDDGDHGKELEALLNSPEFLSDAWIEMNGPLDRVLPSLRRFLADRGQPEPVVDPFPRMAREHPNHWTFLVVHCQGAGPLHRRLLIPRYYSRYDPAIFDHLFDVWGGGNTLESYIEECRKCAVIASTGTLEGYIRADLVQEKGILVV